jgi:hypothetical protein
MKFVGFAILKEEIMPCPIAQGLKITKFQKCQEPTNPLGMRVTKNAFQIA